jgi:hypothetical protein
MNPHRITTAHEAEAPAKALTPAEATEDCNRRMAIAAARRERAESAAYHLAAQGPDGEYLPDGGAWDSIGLARLASAGLASALKAYRTAKITPDTWQNIHGAIVASALAKAPEATEATTCQAAECQAPATWATPGPGPEYLTCKAHRPSLYRVVALPEREACGKAYTESVVAEDGDGNVTTTERVVTPRVIRPATEARVPLGHHLHRPSQGPPVALVNLAWSMERAKGLLADHWAGEAIATDWSDEAEQDIPAEATEATEAEAWASALTWADLAPHLGAKAPAECMVLDLALTDGLERAEAGAMATTYGAKAPMGAEAAKKAAQRATKALAERLTPEAIRAAILEALGEAEAAECQAPESPAILAPATMLNRTTTTTEARAGLAALLNPRALRSAFLARHIWPAKATTATPGRGRHLVGLTPAIVAEQGRRVVGLTPCRQAEAQAIARATDQAAKARTTAKAEAKAQAKAEARMSDPLAWSESWHARADYLARQAEAKATAHGAWSAITQAAEAKARQARREALKATTCRVTDRPRTEAPYWPAQARTEYLAALPTTRPLVGTERPWPATDEARHQRTEALALAAQAERQAEQAHRHSPEAFPGQDMPRPWRTHHQAGERDHQNRQAAEALTTRPLTPAEQAAQKAQKAQAAEARKAWPLAEQKAWQARADAQIRRAAQRAKRAARKAGA